MNPAIATLRADLARIQSDPAHARIGEVVGTRIIVDPKTKRERTVVVRRSSSAVCPRCPVKRACRVASVRLGAVEAEVIGGVANEG